MNIVIVKPVPNGKAHFVTAKRTIKEVGRDGTERTVQESKNKDDRFPGTIFSYRPSWSLRKNKFITPFNKEDLNNYVKRYKLTYESGKKKGDLITEADEYDPQDAFFNHRKLVAKSMSGQIKLDKDNPRDMFLLSCMQEDKDFGQATDAYFPANVKYVIYDAASDEDAQNKKANDEIEAITVLSSLTYSRKVAIGEALGLHVDEKTNPDSLGKIFMSYFKDTTLDQNGKTSIERFLDLSKERNEDIEVKHLIAKAKKAAVLRYKRADGFLYNGNVVAEDQAEMETFLKNPNNADIYNAIVEAVKEKE